MTTPAVPQQAQSFRDIQIDGEGHSLVINQIVQIAPSSVQSLPFVERSPYVGLRRFEERDAPLFFGRDATVAKLLQAVKDRRFTLVAGASGSGKSSLVRAGLVPILQQRMARLRVLTMVPDRDPFARLEAALLAVGFDLSDAVLAKTDSEETLTNVCQTLRLPDESWILFIDQFEEIFTLCTDLNRQRAFLTGLSRLIDSGPAAVKVVVAMRSDFFERFDPYPDLLDRTQPPFFVTSPSSDELRLCIEQPAARHGVTFESGLVPEILRDVQHQPGALPLLSYALDLLWKHDSPSTDRTLNTVSYREIGGISGALRQRADEIFSQSATDRQRTRRLPREPGQQEAMRRLFLRLLDLSEQSENARPVSRRMPRAEFPLDEQSLIDELADEKLLVTNRTEQTATVELAHESLLSTWPRLIDWISEAREAIFTRNRLQSDAAVWDKTRQTKPDQAEEELWTGTRLLTALKQDQKGVFTRLGGLSVLERAFLDVSRERSGRRQKEEQERREALAAALKEAKRQQEAVEQRELDLVVERGRQLLVEMDNAPEAALWLHHALERGSKSPMLRLLLKEAMRPVDAMLLVLRGCQASISSAAFSPDGSRIVSSSSDKTLILWNAHSGDLLLTLAGHQAAVGNAAFSPDGRRIVSSSSDNTVRLWDAHSGALLLTLAGHQAAVGSAAFSPDGRRIVSSSSDNTVRLWDAHSGALLLILTGHQADVRSAAFSPDGSRIVSSSSDNTVRLWDAHTGTLRLTIEGHQAGVNSAVFSPDGSRVVSASSDKTVRLWDAHSGALLLLLAGHQAGVNSAAFSPGGSRIVSTSLDATLRLWDAHSGPLLLTLAHRGYVTSARFSPDGSRIISAGADHVRLWDAHTGAMLLTMQGHSFDVHSAAFSPDSSRIVAADRGFVVLWDAHSGARLLVLAACQWDVTSATFSPDGNRIVSSGRDGTVRLWDAYSGDLLLILTGHQGVVNSAAFSLDGSRIVSASLDNTVRLWDSHTGALRLSINGHQEEVNSAAFSPDGSRIVSSGMDKTVRLWDAHSGDLLLILIGHQSLVISAAFSPDGSRIVSSSSDKTVKLWDTHSGALLLTLAGHEDEVLSAAFSPDGSYIVSSSSNKVMLWDITTETRWPEMLAPRLHYRLGLRLQGSAVVPYHNHNETQFLESALPAPIHRRVPREPLTPSPRRLRWEHGNGALWAGVYALRSGNKVAAKTALVETRRVLPQFGDELALARLTLAEAALDAPADAPLPVMEIRPKAGPPSEQVDWWLGLSSFAQNKLFRPQWALVLLGQCGPISKSDQAEVFQVNRFEFLLTLGKFDDVLREAPAILPSQKHLVTKVSLAASLTIAAAEKGDNKIRTWGAVRLIASYVELKEKDSLGWSIDGLRHAYHERPDSPIRTQALELLRLLEQPKSEQTTQKLAKLLGVPVPKTKTTEAKP